MPNSRCRQQKNCFLHHAGAQKNVLLKWSAKYSYSRLERNTMQLLNIIDRAKSKIDIFDGVKTGNVQSILE